MTVAELEDRMSYAEFLEWGAFYELEDEDRKRNAKNRKPSARDERSVEDDGLD